VPLPNKLWVFVKESIGKDFSGVSDSTIALLPESIVTSEGRNTTGGTDTSPSNHDYILFPNHMLSSLLWCALNGLSFVLIRGMHHALFHIGNNSSANVSAYLLKLIDLISETLEVDRILILDIIRNFYFFLGFLFAFHFCEFIF